MEDFKKSLKTRAWAHYVATWVAFAEEFSLATDCYGMVIGLSDTSKVLLAERRTGVLAQNWSRYRTGERNVGTTTLKIVEQQVTGSTGVYMRGPDGHPLWTALWSNDELELWNIVTSISATIAFRQAAETNLSYIPDYSRLESTSIYYFALAKYFEGLISKDNIGLMDLEDLTALLAGFRLGQYRREAATYQEILGRCLELAIAEESTLAFTLRGYGIADYISTYVDKLIPRSDRNLDHVPVIHRGDAVSMYIERIQSAV